MQYICERNSPKLTFIKHRQPPNIKDEYLIAKCRNGDQKYNMFLRRRTSFDSKSELTAADILRYYDFCCALLQKGPKMTAGQMYDVDRELVMLRKLCVMK